MSLVRFHDWDFLLSGYMKEATQKPFEWSVFDCAINCCDAIHLITGVDLAAQFRGKYHDEETSKAVLAAHGYTDTLDFARKNLPEGDSWMLAHSGDLAAFEYEGLHIVGLVYSGRIWSPSPGLLGMGSVNMARAHSVFKVGEA